jgi:hypothetical protein
VTFGAQRGAVTDYCSVTLWNSRTNFNKAGEYVTSKMLTFPWDHNLRSL